MTLNKAREIWETRPFRPFALHLPDGRAINIEHPDFCTLSKTGRLILVHHADGSESVVDVLLVSDVTLHAPGRETFDER